MKYQRSPKQTTEPFDPIPGLQWGEGDPYVFQTISLRVYSLLTLFCVGDAALAAKAGATAKTTVGTVARAATVKLDSNNGKGAIASSAQGDSTGRKYKAVAVQQRHEELEVLFLAVVRGCRHQQEVPRRRRKQLAEPLPLDVLHLAAEKGRGQLVGLVADDQIPAAVRRLQLLLHVVVAGQLVERGNDQAAFEEPFARARGLELLVGENLERQMETFVQFVLPLLGKAARADHQTSL